MGAAELFTAPWPGPGNSEGPVNPEVSRETEVLEMSKDASPEILQGDLVTTSPWPGPGDSEG